MPFPIPHQSELKPYVIVLQSFKMMRSINTICPLREFVLPLLVCQFLSLYGISLSVMDAWYENSFLFSSPCPRQVFGVEPDLTREGGSIPVTLTFQEATGKNVMLLPVGSADDGAHSQNEKLNR